MTLLQLQYFKTLAATLHYTRAAEQLHISQPSLSYAINNLEEELGTELFIRNKRKMHLSPAGEQLLPYVERGLSELENGIEHLRSYAGQVQGTVRLGYFHSISDSVVPMIVSEFGRQRGNEHISFTFSQDLSRNVLEGLLTDKLDLALCMHTDDTLECIPLFRQELFLVVPENHRLADRTEVSYSDFCDEPVVAQSRESSIRSEIDRIWHENGGEPQISIEVIGCDPALQFVALNYGISIMPKVPMINVMPVRAIPIASTANYRTVYLCRRRQAKPSAAIRKVADFILSQYPPVEDGSYTAKYTQKDLQMDP